MARKFGANCSKCQRSTEQQQSIKCFKIHSKDLLQNNDFHITSSIFLLSSVLVFYFFLILFFNSIVYRFFIARIFGVLPEYFRDWGGCRPPPRPPGSYAYGPTDGGMYFGISTTACNVKLLLNKETSTILETGLT